MNFNNCGELYKKNCDDLDNAENKVNPIRRRRRVDGWSGRGRRNCNLNDSLSLWCLV